MSKKIISIILVFAILFTVSASAFAAPSASDLGFDNFVCINGSRAGSVIYTTSLWGNIRDITNNFTGIIDLLNVQTVGDVVRDSFFPILDSNVGSSTGSKIQYGIFCYSSSLGSHVSGYSSYSNSYIASNGVTAVTFQKLSQISLLLNSLEFNSTVRAVQLVYSAGSSRKTVKAWVVDLGTDQDVFNACSASGSPSSVDTVFLTNNYYRVLYAPFEESAAATQYNNYVDSSSSTTNNYGGNTYTIDSGTTNNNKYTYDNSDHSVHTVDSHDVDNSVDYINSSVYIAEDGSVVSWDARSGSFVDADTVVYDPVNNYYTVDSSSNDSYNISYNLAFNTYYYTTYIGSSAEYTSDVYEVYFELPDGRSSADLTVEEIEQLSLQFDVINYGVTADDGRLRALYHFDGNTDDSSYFSSYSVFTWTTGASVSYLEAANFNGCLYLGESSHSFTVMLPSNLASSDFSILFRYYHSSYAGGTVNDLIVSSGSSQLCSIKSGATNSSAILPIGVWVEVGIIRDGSTLRIYYNGVQYSSTSLSSVLGDTLTFAFQDSQIYRYLDELRVYNYAFASGGANYTPASVPVDTNAVMVLPDEAYAIPDAHWQFNSDGNLLKYFDYSQGNDYVHNVNSTSISYFETQSNSFGIYGLFSGSKDNVSVFSDHISLSSNSSPSVSYYDMPYGTYYVNSSSFPIFWVSDDNSGWLEYVPSLTYSSYSFDLTFTIFSLSGDTFSFTFNTRSSSTATFSWGVVKYNLRSKTVSDWGSYRSGSINIIPNSGVTLDIVYMELKVGDTANSGHQYVTELYSNLDLKRPTIAVRSQIPIHDYRIGGVRPTIPVRGDVWFLVENGYITSTQIYTGLLWQEVECRIWTGSRWVSSAYYNVRTLQDYFDINGSTEHVYIHTEEGYYTYITGRWEELLKLLKEISDKLDRLASEGISGGGSSGSGSGSSQYSGMSPLDLLDFLGVLTDLLKQLLEGLVAGLAEGLEYLVANVIKTITDLVLDLIKWVMDLIDVDLLKSWFNWFDLDHNEFFAEYNDYFSQKFDVTIPEAYPEVTS